MPVSITVGLPQARSGATTYRCNAVGRQTYKSTEYGATYYYINDVQGRTIAVLKANGSLKMLNLFGLDHIGYIDAYYIPQGAKDEDAPRSDARFYFLKDHLGNIKVTVDQGGNVAAYEDYDPYGMGLDGRSGNPGTIDNRYRFISAEKDLEMSMYLLGPRLYDQRIGMFRNVDPMHDVYPEYSPYHYAFNNPLRFVDPTGLQAEETEEQKRAKVYELEEIVVVAPRPPEARVSMSFAYAGAIALRTPNPWIAGAGALILAGVAMHEFLQPLLTKPYASEEVTPESGKSKGKRIDEKIDMTDPSTWPVPPTVDLPVRVGEPSRAKPRARGEKSIYDSKGGEWRPHKPDTHHPDGHWDHKPHPNGPWINVVPK